jgi:hypothetical protein
MLKLKDMLNWLRRRVTYEDITNQFTFVNGWSDYGSFRAIRYPGFVMITGLLKSGKISTNSQVLKIPNNLPVDNKAFWTYLFCQSLGNHQINVMVTRNGYIIVDNNLPLQGAEGHLYAINGIVPLTDFSTGGVLNLAVSLYLRGVQYVETYFNTQGNWAVIQAIDRSHDTEKQLYKISKWFQNLLGTFRLCEIRRYGSTTDYIPLRGISHTPQIQYRHDYGLQFFNGQYYRQEYISDICIQCANRSSVGINNIKRYICGDWLLKIWGCSPC